MTLFDTNLLVYFTNKDSPFHPKCKELVEKVVDDELVACVAHQNLLEYIHVVTDKRQVVKPLSLSKAVSQVDKFTQVFKVIWPVATTLERFLLLLRQEKKLKKGRVFDLYLAATMLSNGLNKIYTGNDADFLGLPGLKVHNPLKD